MSDIQPRQNTKVGCLRYKEDRAVYDERIGATLSQQLTQSNDKGEWELWA